MLEFNYNRIEHEQKKETEEKKLRERMEVMNNIRKDERERVLNELLKRIENYGVEIPLLRIKTIIEELKTENFSKKRKFN